jgi:hypothetical protein
MGRSARYLLQDVRAEDADAAERIRAILAKLDFLADIVEGAGLDHDVRALTKRAAT